MGTPQVALAPTRYSGSAPLRAGTQTLQRTERDDVSSQKECDVCAQYAETYKRNYYAWTHRVSLVAVMSVEVRRSELRAVSIWMRTHVSDASALHYRTQLVIGMQEGDYSVEEESREVSELIGFYEGHEALFCYLRFLIYHTNQPAPLLLLQRLCDAPHSVQRTLALRLLAWVATFKVCLIVHCSRILT